MKKKFSRFFYKFVCCVLLSAAGGMVFARPNSAAEAVRQNIIVEPVKGLSDDFMNGVDISMIDQIEKSGGKFYNAAGEQQDIFEILKDNGVNWIRIRLWNKPVYENDVYDKNGKRIAKKGSPMGGGNNDLETDLRIAKRIKAAGLKFMLDFHYSDFWADPGKQYMPQEWKNLSPKELEVEVEKFTRETINAFTEAGGAPDAVQIGNELNSGFMWPVGQLWSDDPNVKIGGMKQFISLLQKASDGVRNAENGKNIQIVIHLADGGKQDLYKWIFDEVKKAKIDYDIIGLSFYTYWHGSMDDLKANLEMISKRYGKKMAVVETAYAFTEDGGDSQGDVFMTYSDDKYGYVPSVQGQATAIRDVIETVASVKGGCGVFYWEADSIICKGSELSATEGNTWENQAMFDFTGKALPSLAVWNLVHGRGEVKNVWGGSASLAKTESVPYGMSDKVELTIRPGEVPQLPSAVKLVFSDDSEKLVNVKWDSYNWKAQTKAGKIILKGTASGYDFKPELAVEFSDKVNLVEDGSFESGKLGAWKLNGSSTACFLENNKGNARSGKWTYKYWLASGFKSILSREFKDIPNGTYRLSVWAMGGGGENNIRLFAARYDGTEKQITSKIVNTGWQDWHQYTIEVPVTNGKATIGIYLDTAPDCWGNFDDIEFVKVD
ncbi:arabinogalactan endo-1,4-beta-galactosidase [Treponema rectale]|uniref:Arabinogalactan endo-beta-1,4-galactanase n=1 Tax=Treponema rectale TaxID=744512 RepID=A0A840SIR9_9SPIR|nr:glycosyl hydrolase 53 family protein [Treponema rectale]MBB5219282.1 arabinogalactan endo-1,4-beta-galactosidase [Treponema rectale]QOS40833.1 arabinogalactan endo-1,4-beta-galactosidase [Treponema rectale]